MRTLGYLRRSLLWYRWTNAAIIAGAALACAVLGGALLVGASVRQSLRDIAISRLGNAELAVVSNQFFRTSLATDFTPEFKATAMIAVEGAVVYPSSGARASQVAVYGVDDGFYRFHGRSASAPEGRSVWLSPALAKEFNAKAGDGILLRLEEPSDIPRESLHGRRDDVARTIRLAVAPGVVSPELGDFSLRPAQAELRAVFVPFRQLSRELRQDGKANTILLSGGTKDRAVVKLHDVFKLEDLGLRIRDLGADHGVALENVSTILDDSTASHALAIGKSLGILQRPVFTWLANSIRIGKHAVPYSLVAGVDEATLSEVNGDRPISASVSRPIVLNQWAATDLGAKVGDAVTLEYYVWSPEGALRTATSNFTVASITPLTGLAADRTFAPEYPGITDKTSLSGWDPPFPVDLKRIRPLDEQYWHIHRATPKAWIPLPLAQDLWSTRHGSLTAIRYPEPQPELEKMLRAELDPLESSFTVLPVKEQALSASSGSTDFGEYFLYFSFFVIIAAVVLMGLFFRLGVEQRRREVGVLAALGFSQQDLRSLFMREGAVLAVLGCAAGMPLGAAYAALILHGLRTWWSGATGTSLLTLHLDWTLLSAGAVAGLAVALAAVWITLRGWHSLSPRGLMAGPGRHTRSRLRTWMIAPVLGGAVAFLIASASGAIAASGAFFGTGVCLLTAALLSAALWLRRPTMPIPPERSWKSAVALAMRNTGWRPGRSLLCLTLIALASFLLVSLESFRHGNSEDKSGFALYAESQSPLIANPNTREGRETLNLSDIETPLQWTRFRLKPGDDVSCLNLYQPRNPRILGAPESFLQRRSFRFAGSVASSPETERNPWLLLDAQLNAGIIPAIVDETSMMYVLHKKLGDIVEVDRPGATPLRFRLVAAIRDSVFQGELIISEQNFVRHFPHYEGYRVFLIEGESEAAPALEAALADYGFDATPPTERLAAYHRVNDTYISTFQALGSFGLLIGTLGLAAVLLRNTLERSRELALLRATGYATADLSRLLLLENVALLLSGLLIGTLCALVAISPGLIQRGTALPALGVAGLVTLILASGLAATWLAVRAALHTPLLDALRTE